MGVFTFIDGSELQVSGFSFFFRNQLKHLPKYYNKGEFAKAMAFNVEALKKYETLKDKEGISAAYTNIASLLFLLEN